jgi:enamine deaminase RidA (YjgF/YER057c/UK114 family)
MRDKLRFLDPETMVKIPGYSQVVEMTGPGRIVVIAGQLGLDHTGKLVGSGDFRAQAVQAFENLKIALSAVGASFEHVVKLNHYAIDLKKNLSILREVRDAYINTSTPPASTAIGISELAREGALYEVEAYAVLPTT